MSSGLRADDPSLPASLRNLLAAVADNDDFEVRVVNDGEEGNQQDGDASPPGSPATQRVNSDRNQCGVEAMKRLKRAKAHRDRNGIQWNPRARLTLMKQALRLVKRADPPNWAETPELRQRAYAQLQTQCLAFESALTASNPAELAEIVQSLELNSWYGSGYDFVSTRHAKKAVARGIKDHWWNMMVQNDAYGAPRDCYDAPVCAYGDTNGLA